MSTSTQPPQQTSSSELSTPPKCKWRLLPRHNSFHQHNSRITLLHSSTHTHREDHLLHSSTLLHLQTSHASCPHSPHLVLPNHHTATQISRASWLASTRTLHSPQQESRLMLRGCWGRWGRRLRIHNKLLLRLLLDLSSLRPRLWRRVRCSRRRVKRVLRIFSSCWRI